MISCYNTDENRKEIEQFTSLRGVLIQAKCVKCESTLHAMTSVFIFLNSLIRSEKAKISVGQTNVLHEKIS